MTSAPYHFNEWFVHNWSRAALPAGVVLLMLTPIFYKAGGLVGLLVALQLICYMFHQYEEHAQGKFKAFANHLLAHDEPKITDLAIFWVNIIGVWALYVLVILGAAFVSAPLGLIAAYTTLANAVLHILGGVAMRRYNPGLITSIVLFLPVSIYAIYIISPLPETTVGDHILGLAAALILHVLTFGYLGALARR